MRFFDSCQRMFLAVVVVVAAAAAVVVVGSSLVATCLADIRARGRLGRYAIDSLKQLSMKFLSKEEIRGFKFQKAFLKPFETIIKQSRDTRIRELILCVVQNMVLGTHAATIRFHLLPSTQCRKTRWLWCWRASLCHSWLRAPHCEQQVVSTTFARAGRISSSC